MVILYLYNGRMIRLTEEEYEKLELAVKKSKWTEVIRDDTDENTIDNAWEKVKQEIEIVD